MDRSARGILLAALGATALAGWIAWAAWGSSARVDREVSSTRGRPFLAPDSRTAAGPRPPGASFPGAARHELESESLARWLIGGRAADATGRSPAP